MSISERLCKFVEKRFNYLSDVWYFEHVETTLGEILDSEYLTGKLTPDKEVDSFTYFSMILDDEHVYPFIIIEKEQIISLGYIEESEMKLMYLSDGHTILIDHLETLNLEKEMITNGKLD